jgi:hypothetical protein
LSVFVLVVVNNAVATMDGVAVGWDEEMVSAACTAFLTL